MSCSKDLLVNPVQTLYGVKLFQASMPPMIAFFVLMRIFKKAIRSSFIIFLLLLFKPLYAIETNTIQNNKVIVHYEQSLQTVAREVIEIYPDIKLELEKTFKWEIDFRPTITLMKDRKTFQGMFGNSPIVAVAISNKNLIIIDNSKMKTHPFTLKTTLKHELCHLLLHRYVKKRLLPKWLNEGISQWASDGIAEIIIGENEGLLKQATLSGRFIFIEDLTERFPQDEKSLLLAYQESKSIVEYIDGEYGSTGLLHILNNLRDGNEIDIAILESLSIPVDELEKRWHDYLKKRTTWFTYLSSHLYQFLFSFASLVLIYGFIRFLIQKRACKDDEEEDFVD